MGDASNMFLQETISISHFCALHVNTKKKKKKKRLKKNWLEILT